jgi:hypothetical protein
VRFIADVHLGRLAAYLRMVGFDTLYEDYYQDEELARTGQNLLRRKANTPDEGPRAPEAKRYRSRLLRAAEAIPIPLPLPLSASKIRVVSVFFPTHPEE